MKTMHAVHGDNVFPRTSTISRFQLLLGAASRPYRHEPPPLTPPKRAEQEPWLHELVNAATEPPPSSGVSEAETPQIDEAPAPHRALVVDDVSSVLHAVKHMLRPTGIIVDVALSGAQGLRMLGERQYSVVISDYGMPEMSGIDFLEQVHRHQPDTVCILLSGLAGIEAAKQAINRTHLFRFLTKPPDPTELQSAALQACEQYDIIRQNQRLASMLEQRNRELTQLNQRLDQQVLKRTSDLLVGLLNALDFRDTETQGHSLRVALFARRLGAELGLAPDKLLDVERGALLHDIGKIGISDTILLKPGKLTEQEWVEMRRHPIYGYEILRNIDFLGPARLIVKSHHERYDGKGYPDQLKGDAIPIGARIFSIIDTYDAMTSDRPYRKALPPSVAREEILRYRGTQFDPTCVDAFLRIPQRELDRVKERVASQEASSVIH